MAQQHDHHFDRVTESCEWFHECQQPDRRLHNLVIHHLLGEFYPVKNGATIETSINLLSMAYRSMSRNIVSRAPRAIVNIATPELKTWSENGEIALNKRIIRSSVDRELREVASQSLVSFGTFFMGPMYKGTPEGMKLDLEIKAIDRCKFFYDVRSASLEDADIQGHDFDVPVIDVRENPDFDEAMRMKVDDNGQNDAILDEDSNRRREQGRRMDLYDYVTLRCAYEKRRKTLWYFPKNQPHLKLMELPWYGPDHGPYRYLYYEKVAGQAIPTAPLWHLMKKHRAFNMLDVKSIHQQQASKGNLFYTSASKEEAKRIVDSVENQSVLQENGAVRFAHIGGADQGTVAMSEKQKRDFSYAAMNLDQQLGLDSQAPTLGQERLLKGSANEMAEDMASSAYWFVKGVCEDIFWYDLRDPDPTPTILNKTIPGTKIVYAMPWTKEHRQFAADLEYDVDVVPYSYVERSPQSMLADLLGLVQFVVGMADQAAAQGITIDVAGVVKAISKYKNITDAYDCIVMNQDPERLSQLLGPRTGAAPNDANRPNGRYTRESVSDGSGADMEMMRMFNKKDQEITTA